MIDEKTCLGCGLCINNCPVGAISFNTNGKAVIDKTKCINCGTCQNLCPVNAIDLSK